MNKFSSFFLGLALFTVLSCSPAQAEFKGPIAAQEHMSVSQVLHLPDNAHVMLEGYIVEAMSKHERYRFSDGKDSMIVEIDDDLFLGRTITPKDKLRIFGKVDRDFGEAPEVDVKRFEVIGK